MTSNFWPERCSLTGADDRTDIESLHALGQAHPHVEWALLYVPHNEGAPRNPTQAWRQAFFDRQPAGGSAVHLCGSQAFQNLMSGTLPPEILRADRLQLNINARKVDFSHEETLMVFNAALGLGPEIILQYQPTTVLVIEEFLLGLADADRSRVHVLLDASRGTGLSPDEWTVPTTLRGVYCGFAGGLNPDNVASALRDIRAMGSRFWIDMESGIRTDNAFDLAKCERVLAASRGASWAAPLIQQIALPSAFSS